MLFDNILDFPLWATSIEFIGALLIIGYVLAAIVTLVRSGEITHARLIVADGIIASLNFKLAATLLRTIELRIWQQILVFVAILTLRIVLKRLFTWERTQLQRS